MLSEVEITEFKYLAKEYGEEENMWDYDELGIAIPNEELYHELRELESEICTDKENYNEYARDEVDNVIKISNKWKCKDVGRQ